MKPIKEYIILQRQNEARQSFDYNITFRMNQTCNLSCEYCEWKNGENYPYTLECIEKIYDYFKEYKIKRVHFYFHGGEPTIHPKIIQTLEKIRDRQEKDNIYTYIEYQTNFAYNKKMLKKILPLIDCLSISYHYKELKQKKLHQQFIKNFAYLKLINYQIGRLDIMMEDISDVDIFYKNIEWLFKYKNIKFSEMIYSFMFTSTNNETKEKHLNYYKVNNINEQLYKIDDIIYNTNELFIEGLDCSGWKCDAGKKHIYLDGDGLIFNCATESTYYNMINAPQEVKPLTNILTDSKYMTKLAIKRKIGTLCKYNYCTGDFYIERTK